jgi:hypothetical protein
MAAKKNIARIFEEKTPILRAVTRAAKRAIREHARANAPVVVYRDGRTVTIPAKQLLRKRAA